MERRTVRQRKVSSRVETVTASERRSAATARLEALEIDHDAVPALQDSDEEFVLEDSDEDDLQIGKSRGKRKGKLPRSRKTRGMLADEQKGPKSFAVLLEEARRIMSAACQQLSEEMQQAFMHMQAALDQLPPEEPSYLTAAAGPARSRSSRKWCSVCGNMSPYTCTRCGAHFCSKRCYPVHVETRCLKFVT